ncbi:PTS transporter subunit EIIC [Mediterraneibacter sp. gm002]|uniref:PTS transporter subunit EIIC n=1 Tax=Mediterraneibacter sp. gm002 TaxID=2527876 RepID=UPI002ED2C9E1
MKDKIFGILQRIGRSFMLPIAILPVAGLLLGIGSSFTNETTIATYGLQKILGDGTVLHALLTIMNKVGSAVFDNLPLIFAVGVAIGMAKKKKRLRHYLICSLLGKQVFIISLVYLEGSISDLEIVKATAPTLSTV